jgi:hypothetical protein
MKVKDYRPDPEAVKLTGIDAFESCVRLSLTP